MRLKIILKFMLQLQLTFKFFCMTFFQIFCSSCFFMSKLYVLRRNLC